MKNADECSGRALWKASHSFESLASYKVAGSNLDGV
jgi:hypothetical protein